MVLPDWELSTTHKICPIEGCCTIHYQQCVPILGHKTGSLYKQFILFITVEGSCVGHILQYFLHFIFIYIQWYIPYIGIKSKSSRYFDQALRPKSSLRVYEEGLPTRTTTSITQLACHADCVWELTLTSPELPKHLRNSTCFYASSE